MPRAALYVRVSSPDPARQHPEMQEQELREFCGRRGWEVTFCFSERESGGRADRVQLAGLLSVCRRRQVDVVVVWRYDRFARSVSQLVNTLEEFRTLGIDFVSVHEQVDTTTPQGKLLFTVLAGLAEFQREMIRENVRRGLAHARAQGKRLGRPPESPAGSAAAVARLRALGRSWSAIAAEMGLTRSMVQRLNGGPARVYQKPIPAVLPN